MKKYSDNLEKINESIVLGKELKIDMAIEVIGFMTLAKPDFYDWYVSIGKKIDEIQVFVKGEGTTKQRYFVKSKKDEKVQFEFEVDFKK
jgi:hypothetical protein